MKKRKSSKRGGWSVADYVGGQLKRSRANLGTAFVAMEEDGPNGRGGE